MPFLLPNQQRQSTEGQTQLNTRIKQLKPVSHFSGRKQRLFPSVLTLSAERQESVALYVKYQRHLSSKALFWNEWRKKPRGNWQNQVHQ